MNDGFLPTGLLGPGPSISLPAFVSNGLLSGTLGFDELNELPCAPIPDTPNTRYSQSRPHSSDDTSGLDSDGRPRHVLLRLIMFTKHSKYYSSFDRTTLIIAGQVFRLPGRCRFSCKSDDAFPPISDTLGLKLDRSKQNPNSSIRPTPGVLTQPRPSLRATTFDGKLLFIPRKPQTVTLRKVRNRTLCLSLLTLASVAFDIACGKPARCAYP